MISRISRTLALAAVFLALGFSEPGRAQAPGGATPPSPESSIEANKTLVRRYIEEALSGGDLKVLDLIVAPNYVDSSPGAEDGRGPEVIRAAQGRIRALFKDIRYHLEQLVAEGDRVVARYTVHAVRKADKDTDAGDAGREIDIVGMTFFRIADGRIVETWAINDQFSMFRQLGYVLTSPKEQQKAGKTAKPPAG
jgi:predicted ester cyclase